MSDISTSPVSVLAILYSILAPSLISSLVYNPSYPSLAIVAVLLSALLASVYALYTVVRSYHSGMLMI